MKSIGTGAAIAAIAFVVIYVIAISSTGEVGTGNLVVALVGGITCAMVAGLIGIAVRRARHR